MGLNDPSSVLVKAFFSKSWETVNQNFYTQLSQSIDPIDSTLIFLADIISSGALRAYTPNGDEVTDSDPLVKLLLNPNPNQVFADFIKEWSYYLYAHGWDYIVPQASAVGFERRLESSAKIQLYCADPDLITWRNDKSYFFGLFGSPTDEIKFDYRPLNMGGMSVKDVISFYDVRPNPERPHIGISRLLALKQEIQNYSLAQQAKENLIKRSGSTLVTQDISKQEDLAMDTPIMMTDDRGMPIMDDNGDPITTTHKKKLNKDIQDTGLGGQNRGVIFSMLPLKAMALSAGIEKINFDGMSIEDARKIMNKFNIPKELQNLSKESAAKFDDRKMGLQQVVQGIAVPLGLKFCNTMTRYFNHPNRLELDYSHLPIFANDQATDTENKTALVELYRGLKEDGSLTDAEYKQKLQENGIIN